ncbi:MAG: glutamate-1-semialdehyde-2,1-aminomutase [Bacteroidetes bacterium]|nr:MAG: glutamate-1-semialdehyde-2,1-aminomutase [Bacteroidota bacterium]
MQLENRIARDRSAALFAEAKKYFPGGVNSPVRAFKSVSGPPLFIRRGEGCYMWDEDGNRLLDFCCSWGPLILGHNHAAVRQAIIEAVEHGTSFGTPTRMGNLLGKLMIEHNRFLEMVRFVSSGTEAVMSAIRLARGYTGRNKVIKFEGCYHGHADSLLVKAGSGLATFGTSSSAGVPEAFTRETIVLPLDDEEAVDAAFAKYGDDIACVIIEPVPANNGLLLQRPEFLQYLRDKTRAHGALLIFDEVISGFRLGFEGAAGHYGIEPDLLTYGKIIGGGMPVGAYGGKADIMHYVAPDGPVYQAGTLSANPVAMAAGYATLQQLLQPGFYEQLEARTERLARAVQQYADAKGYPLTLPHIASIFWFNFSRDTIRRADQIDPAGMERFKVLHHELLQRLVYLGPSGYEVGFVSAAHDEQALDHATEQMCAALNVAFRQNSVGK